MTDDIGFHPKWVIPFYDRLMGFFHLADEERIQLAKDIHQAIHDIDDEMLQQMLTNSNWRPRLTAAYFVGFGKLASFTSSLGECFVSHPHHAYPHCLALTRLGSSTAISYLQKYMRENLTVEQAKDFHAETLSVGWVLAAFQYLDDRHSTSYFDDFQSAWEEFVQANLAHQYSDGLRRAMEEHWGFERRRVLRQDLEFFLKFASEHFD